MAELAITASQVLASATAQTVTGVAGATITAGMVVYKAVDGKFSPADSNALTPIYKAYGIALNGASLNQPLTVAVSDVAFTLGAAATVVVGETYILSGTTPGSIAEDSDAVTGWRKQIIGVGLTSSTILLRLVLSDTAVP